MGVRPSLPVSRVVLTWPMNSSGFSGLTTM